MSRADEILGNVYDSANKRLNTSSTLITQDIEIGSIEVKNATDDTRAVVKSDGSDNGLVVIQNSVPTHAVTQSGTWNIGTLTTITNSVAVTGTFWQSTQPVSIAATVTVDATSSGDIPITLDSEVVSVADDKASSAGTSTGITVGSTSTTVLASNANRKQAIIINDSNENVYLKFGTSATSNSGIRLNANGGTLIETVYTGIITGICASGSKNVTVVET